jgi:protochlorophyllide reductase
MGISLSLSHSINPSSFRLFLIYIYIYIYIYAHTHGFTELAVVTGTSSGLGRKTALALLRTGEYHVVGAVRDLDKMEAVAEIDEFDPDLFTPMECELNSFASVRQFCDDLEAFKCQKPVDRLICNAGVYQPSLPYAKWSMDGHEQTMQINFLSHFLMVSLLMDDMARARDPRVILVGSVTGNDNTVGGGGVYPIADLKKLAGLKAGFKNPIAMMDGYQFIGAKAYKDSKLALMMLSNILHAKFHKQTGITFSSIYPGCIAESPLFREKRPWFRKYFPIFMKFITGGFVGEEEAGQRLFQVAHDPRCSKSGVYWSWNGGPREDRGLEALEKGGQISGGGGAGGGWDSIYENDQSDKVLDVELAADLFKYS